MTGNWRQSQHSIHHWHSGNDGVVWFNVHDEYVGEYLTAGGSTEVGKFPTLSEAQQAVDDAPKRWRCDACGTIVDDDVNRHPQT